ncbi:hypothetical protein HH219_12580 [Pseudoalteromonas sp. NEC-BIFX-2020_015]|uniref:hypothetical protein n=1 Tax=Pseudoalteromonas sp. NEC-BIFX-2020_015 TaxID=2729544 RepID=UPI0014612E50|nr:hypothetical protein [Pseudoalteromonas sp. NEC-BIFX-2020_015]NMR26358.1 hypothetical protein [Pseudoalteromonas sp. NEC-BIFX-2020_015]
MHNLINQWGVFCKKKETLNKSHFTYIFHEEGIINNVNQITQFLPEQEKLTQVIEDVLSIKEVKEKANISDEAIISHAKNFILEQVDLLENLDDELRSATDNFEIKFVTPTEFESNIDDDIPHYWLFDEFGDLIRDSKKNDNEVTFAFFEALYGIDNDYYLSWYIAAPLLEIKINLSSYYELWKNNCQILLLKDKLLILKNT